MQEQEFGKFLADALMYDKGPLKLDEPFPDLILDSTGLLMLSMAIEEKFGITIPIETVGKFTNPRDLYVYIAKNI